MAVLVTAAHTPGGLAVARALHARGLRVLVEGRPRSLAFYSRAVARALIGPSSRSDPEAYGRFVLEAIRAHGVELVIPADDSSLLALDAVRGELEGRARLVAPASPCLRVVMDKERLARFAGALGVPSPRTLRVANAPEARAASTELGYPQVVKPVGPAWIGDLPPGLTFKARFAARWEDVEEILRPYEAARCGLLLQEYCPGVNLNLYGMAAGGDILGIGAHQSLKTHPVTGLVGLVRETVPTDPLVRDHVAVLLRAMHYDGLFNIQFRRRSRDGTWQLTDLNPRAGFFIGTHVRAGVDLPYLAYEWFVRGRKTYAPECRVGIRGRNLLGDLRHTILVLRGKERGIDPLYPGRAEALKAFFLEFARTHHYDEFTLRDPLPGAMEALNTVREQLQGAGRGFLSWGFRTVRPRGRA